MSKNYDLPWEVQEKLESVLNKLCNVPQVGEVYDQQHSDTHMLAAIELQEVILLFSNGELSWT